MSLIPVQHDNNSPYASASQSGGVIVRCTSWRHATSTRYVTVLTLPTLTVSLLVADALAVNVRLLQRFTSATAIPATIVLKRK
jgi:hypothetical protein